MTFTRKFQLALAVWTAEVDRAKRAYCGDQALEDVYAKRTAASQKQIRYRRRKKAQE